MVSSVSQHQSMVKQPVVNPASLTNADMKEECNLKPNTLKNKLMSAYQKTTSAFIEYPVKGLTGSKKSNFYEFLSMGIVPYLVGSATLMAVFNGASKHFADNFAVKAAKRYGAGNKAALGVLFWGIAKALSKPLISTPVKMATGIDTEMSYERHIYSDPKLNLKHPIHEYEQHKVMESHDFPRYDMMYGEKLSALNKKGEKLPHNYLFDKIAKKNGLGEDLPASDTEVKPIIKDVISRSNTAKSISSYLWAAVGVMFAVQKPWDNFFNALSKSSWKQYRPAADVGFAGKIAGKTVNTAKNLYRISESFVRNFGKASKSLYNDRAGKVFLGIAALSSILGAVNTIYGAKTAVGQHKNVFDKKDKITVQ